MLIAVTACLLLSIALLAIPVSLSYQLSWRRAIRCNVKLEWLFGLVRLQLPSPRPQTASSQGTAKREKRKTASSRKKPKFIAALRQKSFRQRLVKFLRALWQAVQKNNLRLRIRIGLGDPADTGQFWALVGPVSAVLGNLREASVEIEPEFIEAVFELDSSGNIRVVPLRMMLLAIGLLLSPSVWQGIKQMREVEQPGKS